MSRRAAHSARRGWYGVGAAALAVAGLGLCGSEEEKPDDRDTAPAPAPRPRTPRAPAPAPEPLPPPPAPAAAPAPLPNAPPRILSAALDRTRLCPGESTFLRVKAEDPDDLDLQYRATYLSASLGAPRFGFGRWLRFEAPDALGPHRIVAVVQDPQRARDEVPLELWVEDCEPAAFDVSALRIRHTELDAQVHELDLTGAEERARDAGRALEVVRWSFGDGSSEEGGLRVRHRYPVVLDRRHAYYLVRAEVTLDGEPEKIEHGLAIYSYAAANLQAGYVALAADVERGDDALPVIHYEVTFSNLTPLSAWAESFEVVCLDAAGVPRERWREPLDLTVPGEMSLEQTIELDRGRCPGGASYELFGEADGGYAVGGLWSYKLRPSAAIDTRAAREQARRALAAGALSPARPR